MKRSVPIYLTLAVQIGLALWAFYRSFYYLARQEWFYLLPWLILAILWCYNVHLSFKRMVGKEDKKSDKDL